MFLDTVSPFLFPQHCFTYLYSYAPWKAGVWGPPQKILKLYSVVGEL